MPRAPDAIEVKSVDSTCLDVHPDFVTLRINAFATLQFWGIHVHVCAHMCEDQRITAGVVPQVPFI